MVDCKFAELIYPDDFIVCIIPCVVDIKLGVEIYFIEPSPTVVDII